MEQPHSKLVLLFSFIQSVLFVDGTEVFIYSISGLLIGDKECVQKRRLSCGHFDIHTVYQISSHCNDT